MSAFGESAGGLGQTLSLCSRPFNAPVGISPALRSAKTVCLNMKLSLELEPPSEILSVLREQRQSTRSTMANIRLDDQIFFAPPVSETRTQDKAAGHSADDAITIPDDVESDYSDLGFDDDQCDTTPPPIDELLRQLPPEEAGSGAAASTRM